MELGWGNELKPPPNLHYDFMLFGGATGVPVRENKTEGHVAGFW